MCNLDPVNTAHNNTTYHGKAQEGGNCQEGGLQCPPPLVPDANVYTDQRRCHRQRGRIQVSESQAAISALCPSPTRLDPARSAPPTSPTTTVPLYPYWSKGSLHSDRPPSAAVTATRRTPSTTANSLPCVMQAVPSSAPCGLGSSPTVLMLTH